MKIKAFLPKITILLSLVYLVSCGGFLPYHLMGEAAESPERPLAFAEDERLKLRLHEALIVAVPDSTLSVSSYVFQSDAYLVGWVKDENQKTSLETAAQNVSGIRSVTVYLPLKATEAETSDSTSELELKAKVEGALLEAERSEKINISVEVIGTQVIFLGIVHTAEKIQRAEQAAMNTSGVTGVSNFLSLPDSSDAKRFGKFLP